jgi:hypothetical protein
MKLQCRYAVVSYCADLTSPKATTLPVAAVMLCEGEQGVRVAGAVAANEFPDVDPITRAFLGNIHQVLKEYVDQAFAKHPEGSSEELLHSLHDSLRNSLHVSKLAQTDDLTIDERAPGNDFFAPVIARVLALLNAERLACGEAPLEAMPPRQRRDQWALRAPMSPTVTAWSPRAGAAAAAIH